jgi:prepilin-type N-terminal cleavage/methylation domain-containing protein
MEGDIPVQTRREGFTILELMIVVAIIAILLAILVPGLGTARKLANESNAIAGLKTLYLSQIQYRTRNGRVADPLSALQNQNFTDDFTLSGDKLTKTGYEFEQVLVDGRRVIWARPMDLGRTGDRYFAISCSGTIRWSETGRPDENDRVVDTKSSAATAPTE